MCLLLRDTLSVGKGKRDSALIDTGEALPTLFNTRPPPCSSFCTLHTLLLLIISAATTMSALTQDNLNKVPDSECFTAMSQLGTCLHCAGLTAGTEGRRSGPPSAHHVTLSRRSSMSIGNLQGPDHNVDTTQIGVPVVTPRKERPGHKRSLTGESALSLSLSLLYLVVPMSSHRPLNRAAAISNI